MSSPTPPPADSLMNSPLINTITGYIGYFQQQNIFKKESFQSYRDFFLLTVGFLVLLYCLIHIQILFFWLLKLIFRFLFKIVSIIFWLPLKTVRFLMPKTIDYDILFPLFWLCSISSFYISKFFHENICQFYDQYFVRRYKILNYDQTKREDVRRYLFIITFVVLLLLQTLFILLPVASSIRHQHENAEVSSKTPVIVKQTTPVKTTPTKSAAKEVVETMSANLYNRFIDAFTDENETHINTLKIDVNNLTSTDKQSSRFQRWIIHYLKAPFQRWESKKTEEVNSRIEEKKSEDENDEEEENVELNSSSSITDTDESDDDEDDDDDSSEDDEEEEEEHTTITERIKQSLDTVEKLGEKLKDNVKSKISSSIKHEEEDSPAKKLFSSTASDDEESDDEDESTTITEKIKEQIAKPQTIAETVAKQLFSSIATDDEESGYESDDEEEQSSKLTKKIEEALTDPIEKVKNVAENIKNKIRSITDKDDVASTPITEQIKESLTIPINTVKDLGEKVITNVKNQLSSSANTDDEELEIESDEEEHSSILNRVKENVIQPIETAATNLRDKISSNADVLKQKATNLADSAEEFASNIVEKSSEFLQEKTEQVLQIKEALPKPNKVLSKLKHQIIEPSKVKKDIKTKIKHLKASVVGKMKSSKKTKKPKTLTEKIKNKFESLTQQKLPRHKKNKKTIAKKSQLKLKTKLNGWFDEAWNIWHQTKTKLAHIFISSTKHARHLPRYNTTSLYTAFTDRKCYDYTKTQSPYRLLKRRHLYFLDTYRHHSPFPVYLSILKSNGPKSYRHYPNSSCGLILKSSIRNSTTPLYRFVRFWAITGLIIVILSLIYKYLTYRKATNPSSFHQHSRDFDQSSNRKQPTVISNKNDLSRSRQITSSVNQNTIPSSPLNEQIEKQLRLWLQHEQNDGFKDLSEICRLAINDTFLKQLERLSVETLQFANAKIRNVSQNNKTGETTAEKIIINAVLDIDHLILNIVNTFKEQHFSLETQKLSGQLYILLVINPNQYSIEANLQQLQINPVNIIDPNNALLANEKQSVIKLIDEIISRTIVRCSFRLSDNQENANSSTLYNSSLTSYPDTTKTYSSPKQLSSLSIQTTTSRSTQPSPTRYQTSDSIPTVLINDTNQHLYTNESSLQKEPKRLVVRIVKAVKLHNVEQPYCILELNHPKQMQQTSIAKNGLNPFWDERFLFDCNDRSNQIHLQIIDRKKTNKRSGNNYVDTVYADVLIPFSYATSTVYKQDVQISPQYPESIIRIEFSTLSEEEALSANNGFDDESLTDSQTWTFNDRDSSKIEQDYPQRYQQSPSNDFLSSSYDAGALPNHYGLSSNLYNDDRDYGSSLPRSSGLHSTANPFSPSTPLTPRDGGVIVDRPQKSKSFMSSLKHLTLPRRKHQNKNKHGNNMNSPASSVTQLNTSLQSPRSNLASHSLSSEHFLSNTMDPTPIRRSRSISQSFKNLFRSNSKKKANAAKADALGEFENGTHNFIVENPNYLSTSAPTSKKLSFLQRRKSKQKAKQQTDFSTNSLSSYDCSRMESVRDTPVRANVGHPVTMTKSLVR